MKAILQKDKCLAAISERPTEVTDDSKWDEMDGNSIANLHLALADGVLSSIEKKKTAKDIWDHLARLYEARSLHNKFFLKRKLYALRMTESTSVTEHVNNLNTLFSQLTSLDCKIDVQEHCLVFDDVAASILEEENRRNNREDMQTSSKHVEALVVTKGRSIEPRSSGSHNHDKSKTGKKKNNFKSFKCGKQGHFKKDSVANEGRKFFADVWLFDTGATFHMTARIEWFHQYKPISEGRSVYSCNDHELKIIGIGSIMVKMDDGTVRTIRDVRHVKGLKKNLLSLGQLDDLGCKVEIQNKIMKIIKGTLVLMIGEKVAANLYQLKGEIMEETEASVASHSPNHKVAISWHQKLGHIKQNRLKFKVSNSKSVSVLELVHFDVWKAPVQSLGGAKYAGGVKGYRLWDPTAHEVVVSRDVVFMEDKIQENEEGVSTTRETTTIQSEKEFQSNDSSKAVPQHKMNEMTESQAPSSRTLDRERRRPGWQADYVMESNVSYCLLTEDGELTTLQEALNNLDASFWKEAMQEEIKALHKNKTWELVPLPGGRKPIGNKWVYKIKRNSNDQVERRRGVGTRDLILSSGAWNITDYMQTLVHISRGPNKDRINKLKAQLAREFEMKDLGPTNKILGIHIHQDRVSRKIWLSQKSYVKKILQRFNMQDLGSLMFAMICTRPDIAHAVGVVSRYMAEPGRGHWEAVKRILRYVKGTSDVALCFGDSDLIVTGYVDSDYAGDLDGSKSTTGYVFTLSGGTISWVSKLQSVVAMSTTKAEYVAAAQASKEAVWLKMLLEELGYKQEKITLFCDNQSALYLERNPTFHSKTKHIQVQYHFVREKVKEGTVDMQKIHTDDNVADYLTKAINGDKFKWCRSSCGLAKT
nr:retrovirus-related Pol polyprotein from transposon TNT 1-94 [Tanacetum cinerariifolium]